MITPRDYIRDYKIKIYQARQSITRLKQLRNEIPTDTQLSGRKRAYLSGLVQTNIDTLLDSFFHSDSQSSSVA